MRARGACVALTICLIAPLAQLHAQATASAVSPDVRRQLPSIWIGTGIAMGSGSASSASLATRSGGAFMGAVELPIRQALGPASMALRAEGRWAQQSLATDLGSAMRGDVQTVSAGLTLRASPMESPAAEVRRVTPYVLAGVGIARPSTRVVLTLSNPDMPSAQFGQTSSEMVATGGGGVGAMFRIARVQLFTELRTEFSRRDAGTLRTSFGTIGIAFQPHR